MPGMKSYMILTKLPSFHALGLKEMWNAGHEFTHREKQFALILCPRTELLCNARRGFNLFEKQAF